MNVETLSTEQKHERRLAIYRAIARAIQLSDYAQVKRLYAEVARL